VKSSRRIPPALAGLAASILIFAIAAVSALWLYTRSQASHKQDFKDDLLHSAGAAASLIDVKLHGTFVSTAQETSPEYLSAIAVLDRIKNSNKGMKFIYTCVQKHGSIFFVLDPTPAGDADHDGVDDKSHIMQWYPDAGEACRRALATGKPMADDKPYTDSWGTFMSAYAPFFDDSGKLAGVVGVDKELTEYIHEAKGMREAGWYGLGIGSVLSLLVGLGVFAGARALAAADAVKQKALEEAEKAARAKADFLAVMSHEIRTPLSGMMGMLDALLRAGLQGRHLELARKALSSAEGMLSLLNDILDFSKIEAGAITLESRPFDAAVIATEALEVFQAKAEEKGLSLSLRAGAEGDHRVVGDPTRLRQVLLNLIGNAVKFTKAGNVRVTLSRLDGKRLEFRVEDTGIGIPADKLGALFRSFSQADVSTTREYGGTGLGLAICKHLVEAMGGNIGVSSAPGEGTVFHFNLPLPPSGADASEPSSGKSAAPRAALPPGMRVLLVEDNPVNREVAAMVLGELGCRFDTAVNGREAVSMADSNAYAAVLMDCRMPVMDGFQATAAIRELDAAHASVPIIAMTANSLEGDREMCLAAGMDDYLTKPVRVDTLRAALERCLGGGGAAAPDPDRNLRVSLPEGPSIDRATLDELALLAGEGNPDFLAKVIRLFLESGNPNVVEIEKAVSSRNAQKLWSLAHDLKGGGTNMGALKLSSLCQELENAGEAGQWPLAEDLAARVKDEMAKVAEELAPLAKPG
jgi:signal transduction histidine kinase/CheY-like chemotaxis protein/HPt (histidine-containing phosphotransfer) domain-containing protein